MSDNCCICLSEPKLEYKLECGHRFCYLCLKFSMLSNTSTCPLCRQPISDTILEKANINDNKTDVEIKTSIPEQTENYKWLYAGRQNGYWEYDNISAQLLEENYNIWLDMTNTTIEGDEGDEGDEEFNPNYKTECELEDNGYVPINVGGVNKFYFNFKDMFQFNHRNNAKRSIMRLVKNDIATESIVVKGIAGLSV